MKQVRLMAAVSLTVGLFISACSQAPAEVAGGLEAQFGTKLDDRADAVVTDAKRGYTYVGGVTEPGIFDESFFLRSFDARGNVRWERRIDCCQADYAEVDAVRLDGAGNVYMSYSGDEYDDGNKFGFVIKVSPSNKLLYKFSVENSIRDFEVDHAGNIYLTGVNVGTPADDIYPSFLRKYNTKRKLVWERLNAEGTMRNEIPNPEDVALASDGSLYVTSSSYLQTVLTKYSNTGRTLWQKPLAADKYISSVITAAGQDVYLVMNTGGTVSYPNRIVIRKYRSNGSVPWQRTIAAGEKNWINSSAVDADGNLYLSGGKYTYGDADLFSRKYLASGALRWTYAPRRSGTDEVANTVSSKDGRAVYLAGSTSGKVNGINKGNNDAFLLRLNARGQKVWER